MSVLPISLLLLLASTTNSIVFQQLLSRCGFVSGVMEGTAISAITQLTFPTNPSLPNTRADEQSISFPLRFLPNGGCWALRITLSSSSTMRYGKDDQSFTFLGIVDTGSPFLTVPAQAEPILQSTQYGLTYEQYGEVLGGMGWRRAPFATLYSQEKGPIERKKVILGVASAKVLEETGGVFVGLIDRDDSRPTALEQLLGRRYRSFCINFDANLLTFSKSSISVDEPHSLELVDLQPFGPDLYHYAVRCSQLVMHFSPSLPPLTSADKLCKEKKGEAQSKKLSINAMSLNRPLLVVLDTGLTGCIFSDSIINELSGRFPCYDWKDGDTTKDEGSSTLSSVCALDVQLPTVDGRSTVDLSSREKYFYLNSFRLPWFNDEERHPHIIAVGTTFWVNTKSLTVDLDSRRANIEI